MRRWTKRIVIVLAVFGLPPLALYFYQGWQGERELNAVIAELDAMDPQWRWKDLLAVRPKLGDDEDARAVVLNARQIAGGFFGKYKIYEKVFDLRHNATIPPEDFEAFDELMKASAPGIDEARKLLDMPKACFPLAWSDDVTALNFNDIQKVRDFINFLNCAAVWHAHQGNLDGAMDDCLAMQRACQSLANEPTLIVHLVRIAMQAISMHALERVLAQGQPSPAQLQKLQMAWEQFDGKHAMVQCLRGERAYTHAMFEAFGGGKVSMQPFLATPKGASISIWDRMQNFYLFANHKQADAWTLRHFSLLIETLDLPEAEQKARERELDKAPAAAPGLARMLTPACQKVMEANRRTEAQIRCAITALAAERFRREHAERRWPNAIGELCPKYLAKVLDDPYSGQPLQLRVADDGIVIYSVGRDGKQRGTMQEDRAAGRSPVSYELRLWNVGERRKIIAAQP